METRAFSNDALHRNLFAQIIDDLLSNRQSKPRSTLFARFIDLIKPFKQVRELLRRNAAACIRYGNNDPLPRFGRKRDAAALRSIPHCIVDQDDKDLLNAVPIRHGIRDIFRFQFQPDPVLRRFHLIVLLHFFEQFLKVHGRHFHIFAAGLQPRQLQQVGNKPRHPQHFVHHDIVIPLLRLRILDHAVGKRFQQTSHSGQRRAKLMADIRNVISARLLQAFKLRHVLEQPHCACAFSVLGQHGDDRDPKRSIARQRIAQRFRLLRLQNAVKLVPHLFVRDKIHRRMHIHCAKHVHKRRIVMRKASETVDRSHAVGKAREQLVELPFFVLKLINRLGQVIAQRIQCARQNAGLAGGRFVRAHLEIAFGHFDRNVRHFCQRPRNAVRSNNGQQHERRQHQHNRKHERIAELLERGLDPADLLDDKNAACYDAFRIADRNADADGNLLVGEHQTVVLYRFASENILNFGIKINAEILHFYGAPNISDDQRFAELVGNQDGGLARKRLFLDQAIERGLIECPVLILLVDLPRDLRFRFEIVHLNGDIGIPAYIRIRCKRNDVRQQQYQNRCDQYPPKEYAAHGTSLGFKFIADAVDRFDAPAKPRRVKLCADAFDMRIYRARLSRKIVAPHFGKQLLSCKDLSGIRCQHVQDLDLLRRADHGLAAKRYRIALQIDRESVVSDHGRIALRLLRCAAQDRFDACHHLARAERLHDIVVRAELQTDDAVDLLAFCGQHQNGQLRGFADLAADLDTGHLWHHNVKHAQHDIGR